MSTTVVIDVDGVMTDGTFWYTESGKVMKRFGPDDAGALHVLREYFPIQFISADQRGFKITQRRIVHDMGYRLELVKELDRAYWLEQQYRGDYIYIADGFEDVQALVNAAYGIAPANAHPFAKRAANKVLKRSGGDRAVAEACNHLLVRYRQVNILGQPVDPLSTGVEL